MASKLNLIYDVDDPTQSGLQQDFAMTIKAIIPEFVRGDKQIAIWIRPVVANLTGERPWDDDYLSGDSFILAIGNPDEPATGGTFKLTLNGNSTGLTALAFNISATTLDGLVQTVSTAEGYGVVEVTNPETGVYVATWATTGSAVPAFVADPENLTPYSDIDVSVIYAGDETPLTHPQQVITIRQENVAVALPTTTLPSAGVTRTYTQTASSSQNNIVRISFDADGTYGGLYTINAIAGGVSGACGQVGPTVTAEELGLVLSQHPGINFQETDGSDDNIIVTKDGTAFIVEFTDDLSGVQQTSNITSSSVANPSVITISGSVTTNRWRTGDSVTIAGHTGSTPDINGTHAITVTGAGTFTIPVNVTVGGTGGTAFNASEGTLTVANLNLLAPGGVTGVLNLNTYNLANAFWNTEENTLDFTLEIQRTRASGEVRTGVSVPVTTKRDIIDPGTLVPVLFPNVLNEYNGVNYNGAIDTNTELKTVATLTTNAPYALYYVDSTYGGVTYILTASTDAESLPSKVRPNDYAGGTNEKVWFAAS